MSRKLKIRDLTMRDGQQSLFATRMNQECIDRLLPLYENAGFYIVEVWGGAVPDSVMRYLDESPWNRLRKASAALKGHSLLSALSRGRNLFGYVPYPDSVLDGFYKAAIDNGLNVMRIFDALNDLDNVKGSIKMINDLGGIPDGAVCYTVDPKEEEPKGFFARMFGKKPEKIFTDEYFVAKAKAMEAYGAKIVTLKDMAGLVNPARIATLMPKLKAALTVPVDFHTHCTPGYGLASSVMAMIHGVDILDTNIWWFAGGSAAPAIELIYVFANKLGIEIDANMDVVAKIAKELKEVRKELHEFDLGKGFPRDFNPVAEELPAEVDELFNKAIEAARRNDEEELLVYCHGIEDYFGFPKPNLLVKEAEVPGGMYSNMVAQLKALQADDLLDDAMRLIPKVRRDAGLVPLVTPTSQIVGSQAVSLALDRKKGNPDYTNKSNQFISLVKGEYGHTPVPIDPEFREKITGSPEEVAYDTGKYRKPENPVLEEFAGVKLAKNGEEYLLLELLPTVAAPFLKRRRSEEYERVAAIEKKEQPQVAAVEEVVVEEPVTGPALYAPMSGKVVEVRVKPGDKVKPGDVVLVYEAMKMENDLEADAELTVKRVFVAPGDQVMTDQALVEYDEK
ncbi:biotin/lipoyl-containing protein [uncultured Muribaculum sp.]|uniref:biotin/lipoyl-containing protein n=1 Tax=uncultured Muribaculum sp. TaxID=1918613 RepID=UPI0025927A8E|nr:biotin/lipoyl-containing protein [uncultured Muribaculum sp.]